MKIIIYVTESSTEGNQVRFRTSDTPWAHILEAGHIETLEDAAQYAEVFASGANLAGVDTVICLHEDIEDCVTTDETYPIYTNELMTGSFDAAWKALKCK